MTDKIELPEDNDITLPDSVDSTERIKLDADEPDAVAYHMAPGEFEEPIRAFNPQNGRWYSAIGVPPFNETEYEHTVFIDCAYRNCDGLGKIEVVMGVDCECPECGAEDMGREAFQ